jgi:hypothetical protein
MKARVTVKASDLADRSTKSWGDCHQRFSEEMVSQIEMITCAPIAISAQRKLVREMRKYLNSSVDVMYNSTPDSQARFCDSSRQTTAAWIARYL